MHLLSWSREMHDSRNTFLALKRVVQQTLVLALLNKSFQSHHHPVWTPTDGAGLLHIHQSEDITLSILQTFSECKEYLQFFWIMASWNCQSWVQVKGFVRRSAVLHLWTAACSSSLMSGLDYDITGNKIHIKIRTTEVFRPDKCLQSILEINTLFNYMHLKAID